MKSVLAAAVAAFALTVAAAHAQAPAQPPASRCGDFPAPPTLPDGASARPTAMERANEAHQNWSQQMETVLRCRQTEARELRAQYEPMRVHVETRVQEFNGAVNRQKQVCRTWVAELNEYHQRQRTPERVQDPAICEGTAAAPANAGSR
jgi:hypothetical protein